MPELHSASSTVGVVAHFAVQEQCIDDVVEAAQRTMIEPTRKEPGCIRYELWQDLAESGRFAMIEEWEGEDALSTHLEQESLQTAVAALAPMVSEPVRMQRLCQRA